MPDVPRDAIKNDSSLSSFSYCSKGGPQAFICLRMVFVLNTGIYQNEFCLTGRKPHWLPNGHFY